MKKFTVSTFAGLALAFSSVHSQAEINFADDFTYSNGNLAGLTANAVGQGTWAQTGATATSPVQVNGNKAVIGNTGQDIYAPLVTPIVLADGSTFYIGATVNLSAVGATGDYFLHWSNPLGTTSVFQERLYAKSSGAGFIFGYNGTSGAANYPVSTVLNFNTPIRIVLAYTAVAGSINDTFALYVNPTDTAIEGNNTPYMTSGYVGSGAETNRITGINFRQGGGAGSAATLTVDDLVVSTTFTPSAVPEPSVIALTVLGGMACMVAIRRR